MMMIVSIRQKALGSCKIFYFIFQMYTTKTKTKFICSKYSGNDPKTTKCIS